MKQRSSQKLWASAPNWHSLSSKMIDYTILVPIIVTSLVEICLLLVTYSWFKINDVTHIYTCWRPSYFTSFQNNFYVTLNLMLFIAS
jgi:hypothetical protein